MNKQTKGTQKAIPALSKELYHHRNHVVKVIVVVVKVVQNYVLNVEPKRGEKNKRRKRKVKQFKC